MLVLWPRDCRRGGAVFSMKTAVTRVKPPEARAGSTGFTPCMQATRGPGGKSCGGTHLGCRWIRPFCCGNAGVRAGGLREAERTLRASLGVFHSRGKKPTEPSRVWSVPAAVVARVKPQIRRNAASWRERRSGGPRAETGASREHDAVARLRLRLLGSALPEEEEAARVSVEETYNSKKPLQSMQ